MVLLVHGGPWARDNWGFNSYHQWLANRGYDPAYGARPLKRVIQTELQDPLAERILAGDIHDGMQVKVDAASDRLVFEPVETAASAVSDQDEAA